MANEVQIVVKGKDESKAAYASATKGTEKFGKATEGAKKGLGLFKLAAGGLAAAGIGGFLKDSTQGWQDHQKVLAQTSAVIKSTGGAAGVTTQQIDDLSNSIESQTGIDNDNVEAGANMLLTFTNVKNGVGAGNDIFNQATKTLIDMSAAMGTDAKTGAIQLGKALNDPIAGVGALSRVGVTFTEQQKKQIKALVDSGNTMAAQKIILGELTKEFGGSAASQQTASSKMMSAWHNVQDQVGSILLPLLNKLAGWAAKTLLPAVSTAIAWLEANWPKIAAVISRVWTGAILPVWMATINFIKDKLIPGVKAVIEWVREHWPQIQSTMAAAWAAIKPVLAAFIELLKNLWHGVLQPIVGWVRSNWPTIAAVIKTVGILVKISLGTMLIEIKGIFKGISAAIKVVNAAWRTFGAPLQWAWSHVIAPLIRTIANAIATVQTALDNLMNKKVAGKGSMAPGLILPGGGVDANPRHRATGGIAGGSTIMNEAGGELVHLPQGSMVYPAGQTPGAPGGGQPVVLQFIGGSGSSLDALILEWIRRNVRVKGGGNVQTAFGHG